MAGDVIASLLIKLGLDARDVETGVKQTQGAFSGIGTGAKVAFGVAAGAAAVGFGLMAKGAAEMETAQGRFQAATGGSREEAARFADDMNGLVGTNATVGRSFTEIADAGVAIAQQFDATGEAGKALTEDFLAFSKVTRQDAVGAVNDFDAALDAFGEPAERATSLMDQLIASNQKFGTDAGPAAIDALTKMAPALEGMNMGLDDGVALLNLFEAAGVDASKAPTLLNKALQSLKPGQDLDDLIEQLGGIEDPLVRAQEAARIFGVRGGSAMANAIRPGMRSLDEFGISAEQAAGKTDAASEALVTTSDRFRMFFDRVGSGLRGLGADFGPLVSGIAGLSTLIAPMGGKLTRALSAVWGKVGGSAAVKLAVGAAGAVAGLAYTAGAFVASKLVSAAVAAWALMGGPKVMAAAAAAGAKTGAAFAGAAGAGGLIGTALAAVGAMAPLAIPAVIAVAAKPILDEQIEKLDISQASKDMITGKMFADDKRSGEFRFPWEQGGFFHPDVIEEGLITAATKGFGAGAAGIARARAVTWGRVADAISPPGSWGASLAEDSVGRLAAAFAKTAVDVDESFDDIAAAIRGGFGRIKDALSIRIVDPEKRLGNMQRRLGLIAEKLREAVQVGDNRAIGQLTAAYAKQSLALERWGDTSGKTTEEVIADLQRMGIKADSISGKMERSVGRHSQGAREKAVRQLRGLVGDLSEIDLSGAGARLIQSWVAGIRSMQQVVLDAGRAVTGWLGQFFHGSAVPKVGPLAGFDHMGADMVGAWLGGIDRQESRVKRTGARLGAALQPSLSPAAAGAMRGGGRAGGGDVHIHIGKVYGGPAGLRELASEIERAVRPTRRERRRVHLAEG